VPAAKPHDECYGDILLTEHSDRGGFSVLGSSSLSIRMILDLTLHAEKCGKDSLS
jgi:hypothetical protein